MTTVTLRQSGRVVVCDDDVARRWVAAGLADVVVRPQAVETTARTTTPQPMRCDGVEYR